MVIILLHHLIVFSQRVLFSSLQLRLHFAQAEFAECDGAMKYLVGRINSFLRSVIEGFVPITEQDNFTIGNDDYIPNKFIICKNQVWKKQARIYAKKAAGRDNIPIYVWVLKECADILAEPVCALFNSSLREGFVPIMWKSAYICPVPKISPPTVLEKHIRPSSLIPVLAKIMESFTWKWTDKSKEL